METKRAAAIIKNVSRLNVLVIGDFFLDRYNITGEPTISPEFPVLRSAVREQLDFPGAAANIARSFARLGAKVSIAGFLGENEAGATLARILERDGIDTAGAVRGGKTGLFMRIVSRNGKDVAHFHRLDEPQEHPAHAREHVAAFVKKNVAKFDLVFIADYAENEDSVIDASLVASVTRTAKHTAGMSRSRIDLFKQITWVFMNKLEAAKLIGKPDADRHAKTINQKIGSRNVVVTRGRHGAVTSNGTEIAAIMTDVVDPCGAGDTFASTFCASLLGGADENEAGNLAAQAAAIAVGQHFTYCPSGEEVIDAVARANSESQDLDRLAKKIEDYKSAGKVIVFANGFFDLIHSGHVLMLERAKQLGDVLVVGINSDRSTRENKGPGRPIMPEASRIKILSSLRFVDHVFVFDELTPIKAIMKLKPHVIVKGGNFTPDEVIGKNIVEAYGGRVEVIIPETGFMTDDLIRHIAVPQKAASRPKAKRGAPARARKSAKTHRHENKRSRS